MQDTDSLTTELEHSRAELLELAARVQRLIGKRSEREALLEQLHRAASKTPGVLCAMPAHSLCSLCATSFANRPILNVRGATPGARCDQCGQPAIVWIQLKGEAQNEPALASA